MSENSDIFPHLSFSELQPQAEKWVKRYGIIEKVTLHHPFGDTRYFRSDYVNYVVVFEVPSLPPGTRQYQKLKQFLRDFPFDAAFDRLLDKTFVNVYKIDPGPTFREEWDFAWRYSYQEFPDYIKAEPNWLLYQQESESASSDLDSGEISEMVETESLELEGEENSFVRKSKYWSIKYGEESGHFPDHEQFRYLIHLIEHAGSEISNGSLVMLVKGEQSSRELPKGFTQDTNISDMDSDLTREDLDRFMDMGNKLLERLSYAEEKGDEGILKKNQEEYEKYRTHLFNEYGIKTSVTEEGIRLNKLYRSTEQVEKDRQLVKNQIRNAIKEIENELPGLAKHLSNSIKRKQKHAIYDPEHQIHWHISF